MYRIKWQPIAGSCSRSQDQSFTKRNPDLKGRRTAKPRRGKPRAGTGFCGPFLCPTPIAATMRSKILGHSHGCDTKHFARDGPCGTVQPLPGRSHHRPPGEAPCEPVWMAAVHAAGKKQRIRVERKCSSYFVCCRCPQHFLCWWTSSLD